MSTHDVKVDLDELAARFPQHRAVDEHVQPWDPTPDLRTLLGHRHEPLVLRGVARSWPASRRWTWEHLAEKGTGIQVAVNRSIREQYRTASEQRDLGDYLRSLLADDGSVRGGYDQTYVAYSWLFKLIPELRDDIPLRALFGRWTQQLPAAWIGPAGTVTGLHSDNGYPNVLAQIRGRKSVLLFEPGTDLYETSKYEWCTSTSTVDLQQLDFEQFPRLRQAVPLVAHLDEGDGLFIPARWWHFVVSQTPSVSVSTFFGSPHHFLPLAAREVPKNLAHRARLYKRGNCICHS